jgi:hypothetical protein
MNKLIEKHKYNFSVIITFYVLLYDFVDNLTAHQNWNGLISSEIRKRYNDIAKEYGKKDFANSYLQRHTKTNDFFIEKKSYYKIRPELIEGLSIESAKEILKKIKANYDSFLEKRIEVIREIEKLKDTIEDKDTLKNNLNNFMNIDGFNKGQLFEIISYSILHEYFKSFGFSLNRFSTTFSNDGGIDFIAQNCVYQVTFNPTKKKIEGDLEKLPEVNRVMVLPELKKEIRTILSENKLVLGIITQEELLKHFFPRVFNMCLSERLIDTIVFELNREL